MAISAICDVDRLDEGSVLAPERYDPRRRGSEERGSRLGDVIGLVREQVSAATADQRRQYVVLATGDASSGIVKTTKAPNTGGEIGSVKNRIRPGQVIISRLRPYLRQVAWIDRGLLEIEGGQVELVCSTEYYVLDSEDGQSIAFLVPFLLSQRVQLVLAASQEGGHHPRFSEETLKSLLVPESILERRAEMSTRVERAVTLARRAFREVQESIEAVEAGFGTVRS